VETKGYKQDGTLVCVFRRRVMVPKMSQREAPPGQAAAGFAEIEGDRLWLNPHRLSLHTIAHELTHLLQGRGLVPRGERSCDLFALARDATLVDALPYYLKVPRTLADHHGWLKPGAAALLHELAVEAKTRRMSGERRYLRWFESAAGRLG
jgi:hypothetical protein